MVSPKELPSRWSCCSKKDAAGLGGNYQVPILLRAGPEALSLLGRGLDRVWPNGCKEFLDI